MNGVRILAVVLVGWLVSTASAQTTYTWDGGGTDGNWSTAANWDTALVSHPITTLIRLEGNTNTSTIVDVGTPTSTLGGTPAAFELFRLTFATNAGPFTISPGSGGPPLRISGANGGITIENGNTADQEIAVPLLVGAGGGSHIWTHNGTGLLTISGPVTMSVAGFGILGTGNITVSGVMGSLGAFNGITHSGTGTVTLSGANTYNGTTAVTQGILKLAGGDNRLPTGTTLRLGSGTAQFPGTLDLNGTSQQLNGLTTGNGLATNRVMNTSITAGTLILANTTANSFLGTLGGPVGANFNNFSLRKEQAGVLTLTGTNSYTGPTHIDTGTLKLSGTGSIAGSSLITVGATTNAVAFLDVSTTGTNPLTGGVNFDTITNQFALVSGQTLEGAGRGVTGGVTVRPGATVRGHTDGTNLNTLTVSGNLTLVGSETSAGGKIRTSVRENAGVVTNTEVTVAGLGNDLDFTNLGPGKISLEVLNAGGMELGESYTITLVNVADQIRRNGLVVGGSYTFNASDYVLSSPDFADFTNVTLFTNASGDELRLTFTPIPEPGALLAIAALSLVTGGLVRRRFGSMSAPAVTSP